MIERSISQAPVHRDARGGVCAKKSREEPRNATAALVRDTGAVCVKGTASAAVGCHLTARARQPRLHAYGESANTPPQTQYLRIVAELERQSAQAQSLASGLDEAALNWQPNGGKSWSVAQCLDHLVIMNAIYVKALQAAVESNRDQLEPRKVPIQASGWFTRLFIGFEEPPPKLKLPAPKKICSAVTSSPAQCSSDFEAVQKQLVEFVRQWGETDLGDLKVKDPLFPLHLTVDTELLIDRRPQPAASVAGGKGEEKCGVSALKLVIRTEGIHHGDTEHRRGSQIRLPAILILCASVSLW